MSKHKLLLADDSITIQKVVNLTFADEGVEVTSVGDGNAAMEKLAEFTPDLVMADINMPGLNGYEICERIRKNEATRHIPVILLVGSFEPFDEEEARRVGANDFLTKPFQSIRQLVTKVSGLLESTAGTSTDEFISDLEMSETKAMPGEFEDTLKMPAAVEEFGDTGMDDDLIQTNQVGGFGLDEMQKFQSKPEAENEPDYAKTQPLSTAELSEISSYQKPEQTVSEDLPGEDLSQAAAQTQTSTADERGYAFVGDAPYSAPTPVAEEEPFQVEEVETPVSENQYYNQNEYSHQPEEAEVSPKFEADSTLELEDDGNLLELPPQAALSAAALSQPVWQEDIAPIDESFEPYNEPQKFETSETNQFAPSDEMQKTVEEMPETVNDEAVAEVESNEVVAEDKTDETSDENQTESNVERQKAVAAGAIDTDRTQSSATAEIQNLSPEVIETIAAKVSERFSDEVIRQIVAEIIPQITELIVKRISEEDSKE